MIPTESKECSDCHQYLPLGSFWKNRQGRHGRYSRCKECHRQREVAHTRSSTMARMWGDPQYRKRLLAVFRSPEFRQHQGFVAAGKPHPWNKNHPLSAACKAKLSAIRKGRPKSDAHKAAISAAHLGKKFSDAHRASLSAAHRGKKLSDETKAKIGAAHRGSKRTIETRERMAAARSRQKFPFNDTVPERLVREWLVARGVTPVPQGSIPGVKGHRFDFLLPHQKVAIEADGCYFHACPTHHPDAHADCAIRDRIIDTATNASGWRMVRLWEHEILAGDFRRLANVIKSE
jgi:very-short-patch-repair endonuclease